MSSQLYDSRGNLLILSSDDYPARNFETVSPLRIALLATLTLLTVGSMYYCATRNYERPNAQDSNKVIPETNRYLSK